MEKQAFLLPLLSLKEMALRKSVVHLTVEHLRLQTEFEDEFRLSWRFWKETDEGEVKGIISRLVLPESLKERMTLMVLPIGLQVDEWVIFTRHRFIRTKGIMDNDLLRQLSWTSAASIDYGKTAANIVRLQTLDPATRFKIASGHCLVDSLPPIWTELPEEFKKESCESFNEYWSIVPSENAERLLQFYWARVLEGQGSELLVLCDDFQDYVFRTSVQRGNKLAAEYFFQKFPKGDQLHYSSVATLKKLMNRYIPDSPLDYVIDVWVYLFRQMTPERQMLFIRDSPGLLFQIFLHSPWQYLFLDATDLMWNLIPEDSTYDHLLFHIQKMVKSWKYYFPELFREFFRRSPRAFKKRFVSHPAYRPFTEFLDRNDEESVKVILRNLEFEDRVALVSSSFVFESVDYLLARKRRSIVELCIREVHPSKDDRARLKEVYLGFHAKDWRFCSKKGEWERFFEYLDENDASVLSKKRSEDETVSEGGERKESYLKKRKLQ